MSIYKIPIESALLIFPIIAFIFTLPYLIYQYRKYGAVLIFRSIIIYSFILYLLCAYFLVILPLPSIESVKNLTTPTMQLTPFQFVIDFTKITEFNWQNPSSYINLISNEVFYVALFNIFLTIPFGIYLKYYYQCKWYKVIFYGFLLSLFFEITQLSGLYFIYPRAYRLFDVDDLILNTFGAWIGCFVTPLVSYFLPSRKQLDEKSFIKGQKVSLFRRTLSYCIDLFFLVIMVMVMKIITYNTMFSKQSLLISILIYYLIIPIITNGQTLGKMILRIRVISKINNKTARIRVFIRYVLSYLLFYFQFIIINNLEKIETNNNLVIITINISIVLLRVYFCLNIISLFMSIGNDKKEFLYEKITKTKNISTIDYPDEIVDQSEKLMDNIC